MARVALIVLFFLNMANNKMLRVEDFRPDFDVEKINLTSPVYTRVIDKYRYDDVVMPYRLRMVFYQSWLNVFLWIDSSLKLLSPTFWVRVLGWGGFGVFAFGLAKVNKYFIWWLLTVVFSSGLGILIDTKAAIILATPAIIMIMIEGLKNKTIRKYWYVVAILLVVDLILR